MLLVLLESVECALICWLIMRLFGQYCEQLIVPLKRYSNGLLEQEQKHCLYQRAVLLGNPPSLSAALANTPRRGLVYPLDRCSLQGLLV